MALSLGVASGGARGAWGLRAREKVRRGEKVWKIVRGHPFQNFWQNSPLPCQLETPLRSLRSPPHLSEPFVNGLCTVHRFRVRRPPCITNEKSAGMETGEANACNPSHDGEPSAAVPQPQRPGLRFLLKIVVIVVAAQALWTAAEEGIVLESRVAISAHHSGVLPWHECVRRFPGLIGPPVYIPAVIEGETAARIPIPLQTDIPVYTIAYNNPTFVRAMMEQVDCYGSHVVVVDSASSYPPMVELLDAIDSGTVAHSRSGRQHRTIRLPNNTGPQQSMFSYDMLQDMPQFAAITDADIAFNPMLPPNFLEALANLTLAFPPRKAGFALNISAPERFWPGFGDIVVRWESQFWVDEIKDARLDAAAEAYKAVSRMLGSNFTLAQPPHLYYADVDTTFAVYNIGKLLDGCGEGSICLSQFYSGVRVAGIFTSEHVPWLFNFTDSWGQSEVDAVYGGEAGAHSTIAKTLRKFGIISGGSNRSIDLSRYPR
jgi:hypothetical protein